MRLTFFSALVFLVLVSCNDSSKKPSNQTAQNNVPAQIDTSSVRPTFLSVTDFLQGQIQELKKIELTPLRIVTKNNKADSTWIKREEIAAFATAFLHPKIDSA